MPAPAIVTPADIAQAAATLTDAGEKVTGWRLRRVLGRGRPERLEAIWREQQAEAAPASAPEPEAPPLPPSIAEHLAAAEERARADVRGLVAAAWRLASDLAARRVAEEVRDARERVAGLEAELDEAARAIETSDSRGDALEVDLGAAKQTVAAAEAALAEARANAERAAAAAAARQEAATQEAGRLRDELAAARMAIGEARAAAARAEERAASQDRAVEEARAERAAAREEEVSARTDMRRIEGIAAREGARAEAAERRAQEASARAEVAEAARQAADRRLADALAAFGRASTTETQSRPAETESHDTPKRGGRSPRRRPVSRTGSTAAKAEQ